MAKEETVTDIEWEEMKDYAVETQQDFYESLSDCTIYESHQHKYLKQNIGYAIYGPPTSDEDTSTKESNSCYCKPENSNNTDTDITDTVDYGEKAQNLIDKIYKKICDHSIQTDSQQIYFGIIYVVIFRPKREAKEETKTNVKEKVKKEIKEKTEEKEIQKNEEKLPKVSPIPIFTIRKSIHKNSNPKKNTEQKENTSIKAIEPGYETWYIATNCKVYKSWTDLTENINLPECTMVVPKDGFYQPDPSFPITEDYSTVWIEIMDSPACSLGAKIIKGIDIANIVVGFGTIGLGIASLVTPIGPAIAVAGVVAAGTSGTWTTGRSIQELVKRSNHEESISPLDKEAFPHYLGIAGAAFGLGAMGGSAAISTAAARGMTVPNYAKIAFNTVQGGNIFLNGVGVVYQGYCIIDKYLTEQTFSYLDTLYFATHLLFFAGSVVKIQFADDIIQNTQGKVLSDYRETLRTKRLRHKFNRKVRKAAANNTSKISENADVICYIRNREQLQVSQPSSSRTLDKISRNIVWSVEQDKVRYSGIGSDIVLLDPIKFVIHLIQSGKLIRINQSNPSSSQNCSDNFIADQLLKVLCDLLKKFHTSNDCPKNKKLPVLPDFEPLIKEMSSMNIDEEYLKKVFDTAVKLIKRSKDKEEFLLLSLTFVWQYCKANLNEWGIKSRYRMQSDSGCRILQKIITVVFEAINMILDNLYSAFLMYVKAYLHS